MKRHNGRVDCYWVADQKAVKAGYPVKTAKLRGDPADPIDFIQMADRCRVLQAEMLQWLDGQKGAGGRSPAGTIAWLGECFELDADSPIHGMRHDTKIFYARYIATIKATVGERTLASVTGRDIRRWHKQWEAGGSRSAYACVQSLRRIISYGCEAAASDNDPCLRLASVLEQMAFKQPKGRTSHALHEHILAFRPVALAMKRPSIALAVTLQFDLGLRQKDVIGEWVQAGDGTREGIMDGAWRWQIGLTWAHIDSSWILRKPTSKSNGNETAEHDLKAYPETLALLQSVPLDQRIGPVIIDEHSRKPWRRATFSRAFRKIANKSGWPKSVWNMDSRAGAVTEAFEAGAQPADVMKTATHTQMSTTMGYHRDGVVQSGRVADLRMARRAQEQNRNK